MPLDSHPKISQIICNWRVIQRWQLWQMKREGPRWVQQNFHRQQKDGGGKAKWAQICHGFLVRNTGILWLNEHTKAQEARVKASPHVNTLQWNSKAPGTKNTPGANFSTIVAGKLGLQSNEESNCQFWILLPDALWLKHWNETRFQTSKRDSEISVILRNRNPKEEEKYRKHRL